MLKPINLYAYEILFVVSEDQYLSAARKSAYTLIRKSKKSSNNTDFWFDCLIMPSNGKIDMGEIVNEGYILRYEPKSRKA